MKEMPPLRDRIISNFSSLISDLDSETVFRDLLKLNLVTEQEVQKDGNKQNRFILIKLIDNCGELDKKIKDFIAFLNFMVFIVTAHCQLYFNNIVAVSFIGGGNRLT
jgi:hypothetical protein